MRVFICALALLPLALAMYKEPGQYFDPLKEGRNDFRLLFRGTANTGESLFKAYTQGTSGNVEPGCKGMDFSKPCTNHYRNDEAFNYWWNVKDILFGIVKDGVIVKSLMFDGKGTNNMNWFARNKVRAADNCWKDFTTFNIFSIAGHAAIGRRWFVNRNYGGCHVDAGWVVVTDNDRRVCPWEKKDKEDIPIIKYAPGPSRVNWSKDYVAKGDAIVVLIRYNSFLGTPKQYVDLFGQGKREWRLAFRGTNGAGAPMLQAYQTGAGIPAKVQPGCMSTDWSQTCNSHYRNKDVFDNWRAVSQVLFGVVDGNALVKTITFNAKGTNMYDWFRRERVIDSCWHDLRPHFPMNIFNIFGHAQIKRHFYINHRYGGCPNDIGWIVAADGGPRAPCPWERAPKIPKLLYATGNLRTNWNLQNGPIKQAKAFVIFVKYGNY